MFTYRIEIKLIKIGVVNIKLKLFSYNKIYKVYKNRCCKYRIMVEIYKDCDYFYKNCVIKYK